MSNELGTLVVVVLKARNLPDKHSFYKQDVFAQVTLQGTTKKTQIDVKGGQHPVWDEELRFPVLDQGKKGVVMEVSCWSKEPRSHDLVGKGELDISETLNTGEFDDWVPLNVNNVQRGDLYLEMTFYAAGPPPALSRRPSKMLPADRLARPLHTSSPTPSSPALTAGSRPASAASMTHLRPQSAAPQRLSPRVKEAELPSLPEEPESNEPTPAALPAFLRPGGGKARSPQHRPQSSGSLDGGALPLPGTYSSPPPSHQGSLPPPSHQGSLPPPSSLRPGGGRSPIPRASPSPQTSSYIPESQIPTLPSVALGNVPASTPTPQLPRFTPPPIEPVYDQRPIHTPSPTPTPHQPAHTSPHTYPTYDYGPQPALSPTQTPQPTAYGAPQAYPPHDPRSQPAPSPVPTPHPPATYTSPPQNPAYEQRPIPALPPQHNPAPGFAFPQVEWQAPPPTSYPHLQPSTYTAGLGHAPGFAFPAPGVTPHPPPSNGYYAPYGPSPASRPYPYNYPPPPHDPDFEPPAHLNNPRYQKPLPLPDEPEGVSTPTPAHPQGHVSPTLGKQNGHHKQKSQSTSQGKGEGRDKYQSAEERDRLVALAIEQEEEARKRRTREQEERDLELARRLDMELNLDEPEGPGASREETVLSNGANGNDDMPGAWNRH